MKKIAILFVALVITKCAYAQQPDKALARVSYTFSHIQDTTQKDKPYTENMLLVIGKNASVYTSYDKISQEIDMKKKLMEQIKEQAGSANMSIKIDKTGSRPTSNLDYYFYAKENKFITKERVLNNYLIEEDAPKIDWKIAKDTASFSGIHCQKATAYFKGRNWIAWFAPALPFQSGPWKLNGLPGLIVEAYDQTKTVKFQFAGLETITAGGVGNLDTKDSNTEMPGGGLGTVKIMGLDGGSSYLDSEIKLPADAIKATRKEIDKLKEARDKDPQGFMNAQMAGSGVSMNVTSVRTSTSVSTSKTGKIAINNPIELPEQK